MTLYEKLVAKQEKLALVGLGYVGMPIAVAFAGKGLDVIGFDLNEKKIDLYRAGVDPTKEVGDEATVTLAVFGQSSRPSSVYHPNSILRVSLLVRSTRIRLCVVLEQKT